MAEKNVSVRLVATGGGQVRAELTQIGAAGDAAFKQVGASADSASTRLRVVGDAAERAGAGASAMGGDLRQTTMQLSQVAQQGAATGQWLQALAIQLPDLALGFGPVGIMAGAAAGALLMLAPAFIGAGRDARLMEEQVKATEEALDALARSSKAVQAPIADLKKLYGESADEVERLNRANLAFDQAAAAKALKAAMDTLGLSQGSFERPAQGPQQPGMFDWLTEGRTATRQSEYEATLTRLSVRYGLMREDAKRLADALEAVTEAAPGAQAIAAAADLQDVMLEVAGSADKAADKFGGEGGLWESARTVADLAKQSVEAVTSATRAMTSAFETSISTLEQLRGTLDTMLPGAGGVLDQVGGWIQSFRDKASGEFGSASKGILDLIGWAEGTDKGRGYNETLGYGAFTGGPVNLVNMTLREVLALQRQMLAHPDNSYNSSAVGRYQIVGTTLGGEGLTGEGGLIKKLRLDLDQLFDEQLQDRLAMELVRGRAGGGLRGWYDEWQGFEAKGVSMAAITGALGAQSIGVDPGIAAARKAENDELKRGLDLRADFVTSLEQQVMAAAAEAEMVGKSAYEQARLRAEMMLTQNARAKGIDLGEKIAGTEKTYGQAIQETAHAMATAAQEQAAREGQMKAAEDAAKKAADTMRKLQDDLKQGFSAAFQSVIDGTKSVSDAFRDMVAKILAERAALGFGNAMNGLLDAVFGGFSAKPGVIGNDALSNALRGTGAFPNSGGFLARAAGAVMPQAAHVTVGVDPRNGNLTAFVDNRFGANMRQADRAMPSRVSAINRDPLKR